MKAILCSVFSWMGGGGAEYVHYWNNNTNNINNTLWNLNQKLTPFSALVLALATHFGGIPFFSTKLPLKIPCDYCHKSWQVEIFFFLNFEFKG